MFSLSTFLMTEFYGSSPTHAPNTPVQLPISYL